MCGHTQFLSCGESKRVKVPKFAEEANRRMADVCAIEESILGGPRRLPIRPGSFYYGGRISMKRIPNAISPGPGQESVWDYPRPPRLEPVAEHIIVRFAGVTIADSVHSFRVLETSHPPVYYISPRDIRMDLITVAPGHSFCEFKGVASYISITANGRQSERAGWYYAEPSAAFRAIAGHVAFYASRVDEAYVGPDIVIAQSGDFYGGWITPRIVGPFKGAPGTMGW